VGEATLEVRQCIVERRDDGDSEADVEPEEFGEVPEHGVSSHFRTRMSLA